MCKFLSSLFTVNIINTLSSRRWQDTVLYITTKLPEFIKINCLQIARQNNLNNVKLINCNTDFIFIHPQRWRNPGLDTCHKLQHQPESIVGIIALFASYPLDNWTDRLVPIFWCANFPFYRWLALEQEGSAAWDISRQGISSVSSTARHAALSVLHEPFLLTLLTLPLSHERFIII